MKIMSLLIALAVFLAVVASWGLSFVQPHSVRLAGGYGLRCERGTVQLRHEHETDFIYDVAGAAQVDAAGDIIVVNVPVGSSRRARGRFGLHASLPFLDISPWRPYARTWAGTGGYVTRRDGTHATLGYKMDVWAVAHWVLAVPLLLLSGWLVARAWHRRRRNGTVCTSCGYDLRATPQRCPECGAIPEVSGEAPHNPPMQRTATASTRAVE